MYPITRLKEQLGFVVPVYFEPSVPAETVRRLLEETLRDCSLFAHPESVLLVLDAETTAYQVLLEAGRESPLYGHQRLLLEENRGKSGAIAAGLGWLLDNCPVQLLATRDCDAEHALEDLPRLAAILNQVSAETEAAAVAVIGSRVSLLKSMGWAREEWELLANRVLIDLLDYALAREGRIMDRRFWGGECADIQSGYRLYDRKAAQLVVEYLKSTPNTKSFQMFACELLSFGHLIHKRTIFGQIRRLTRVEQTISSYASLDFARSYGEVLGQAAREWGIASDIAVGVFDNHLQCCALYDSDHREAVLRCRSLISPDAADPLRACCL